jgi:hypothetical protein
VVLALSPRMVWMLPLLALLLVGSVSAAVSPATLTVVPTLEAAAASSLRHASLTECHGKLYYTITATTTSSSTDGLYRYDGSASELVVATLGKMRGLTCHASHLYYFRRVLDTDSESGMSWGLFRYRHAEEEDSAELFLGDATDLSHESLTAYEGDLFLGGRGPKVYQLTTTTASGPPTLAVVWTSPGNHDEEVFATGLAVHKGEKDNDLYFVALYGDHPSLWKFNAVANEATMLKDLVLRTGHAEGTSSGLISYQGNSEFQGSLYFSLGPFESSENRYRLARWDGKNMLMVNQVTDYDPSQLTVFQGSLYMSLRDSEDPSKYALWSWDGRLATKVAALSDQGKIHHVEVWEEDILVMAGKSGPLVVWNGNVAETVTVTTDLADIGNLLPYKGDFFMAASQGPSDDDGNKIWSMTKGVFQMGSAVGDDSENGGNDEGKPNDEGEPNDEDKPNDTVKDDETPNQDPSGDTTGGLQPAWSTKKEVSRSAGKKFLITMFILLILGGIGWFVYKKQFGSSGVESLHSSWSSEGDKGTDNGFMA